MQIPRVFHQIWLGVQPLPEPHAAYQRTWLAHHPGWELKLWTEDNLPATLRRPEPLDRLRHPVERSAMLRHELLWLHGGVYLDTDFECLRSIEPLIGDAAFFTGCKKPGIPQDGLYGSIAGHPILDLTLDRLIAVEFYEAWKPKRRQFAEAIDEYRDEVLFLDPVTLYASEGEMDRVYAVHHDARGWKDANTILRRLREVKAKEQKWRSRYERAVDELAELRARHEHAEAELDRLRHEGVGTGLTRE